MQSILYLCLSTDEQCIEKKYDNDLLRTTLILINIRNFAKMYYVKWIISIKIKGPSFLRLESRRKVTHGFLNFVVSLHFSCQKNGAKRIFCLGVIILQTSTKPNANKDRHKYSLRLGIVNKYWISSIYVR